MNDFAYKFLVLITGLALGTIFFGGLWLTVKKALLSKKPALWFLGSLVVRTGLTIVGFYYIARGNWINMLICLVGFVIARLLVLSYTKIKHDKKLKIQKDS